MTESNYGNQQNQRDFRGNNDNYRSNFKGRFGANRDGGGFRIRLSDNEMKSVKLIQETFQLKSTVAVLGFSVRTLSEMLNDEKLKKAVSNYAQNNKNLSSKNNTKISNKEKSSKPNPFERPVKNEKIDESKVNIDE